MPTWPASLTTFIVEGYQETTDDIILRTTMDAGNVKTRRRFTAAYDKIRGDTVWTDAQLATWMTWFKNDIQNGALSFDMPHPRTKLQILVRYATTSIPISPFNRASTRWRVAHELEIIP
jgi:hypothetical protein